MIEFATIVLLLVILLLQVWNNLNMQRLLQEIKILQHKDSNEWLYNKSMDFLRYKKLMGGLRRIEDSTSRDGGI